MVRTLTQASTAKKYFSFSSFVSEKIILVISPIPNVI